jgi:hypothetical protein
LSQRAELVLQKYNERSELCPNNALKLKEQ